MFQILKELRNVIQAAQYEHTFKLVPPHQVMDVVFVHGQSEQISCAVLYICNMMI